MRCICLLAVVLLTVSCAHKPSQTKDGAWQNLFDGKSLKGWDGNPKFWRVENGTITGQTTKENPTVGNTFIVYTGENKKNEPVIFGDFEIKFEYSIPAGNSGFQYRSFVLENGDSRWRIGGYQADFDANRKWAGTNWGEKYRRMLAKRGEKSVITGAKPWKKGMLDAIKEVTALGDYDKLKEHIKPSPAWNEMHIIAKGNTLIQKINGVTMTELIDKDVKNRRAKGLIAIQLHAGPPMKVHVKNIRIKEL